MIFETAKANELDDILAFYDLVRKSDMCAWHNGYPGKEEIDYDFSRASLFVLKDEGRIIGTISIDKDEAVEGLDLWSRTLVPAAELSRLGVHPDMQNKGIARLLLKYAMEELKRRGMKGVHFLVAKSNLKAINSYKKLNFDKVGECRLFEEDWWCYEKEL